LDVTVIEPYIWLVASVFSFSFFFFYNTSFGELPMNSIRTLAFLILLPVTMFLSEPVTANPNTFQGNQTGRAQTVQMGTVYALRDVTIQNEGTRTGNATGAALGGIAGSTLGSGRRANTAGAVGGAVAGRAVGNAVTASNQAGVEITVLLESNLLMSVVQAGSSNDFRVGDSVRVTSDGQTTRIVRN
jgi:outer membrane lipoprotein SlyB